MPVKQPLQTVSVVDAATNRLRDSLFAGAYDAGQEIKDSAIAQEYGIARPTARLAIQQLINEGMLIRPPGLSARVRTFDAVQIRDLYRVRWLIELDSLRDIREHELPLSAVEEALAGFAGLRGDENWARIAEADAAFHAAVVNTAGSRRLQAYFAGTISEIRLLVAQLKEHYTGGTALYGEHEELYELLKSGSWTDLEDAWTAHLDSARRVLEQQVSTVRPGPPPPVR